MCVHMVMTEDVFVSVLYGCDCINAVMTMGAVNVCGLCKCMVGAAYKCMCGYECEDAYDCVWLYCEDCMFRTMTKCCGCN